MRRIFLKIALFFGLLFIAMAALFLIPYSEEFAYHFIKDDCYNHGEWIHDRITHNPVPIDVAFIGSSHTIHAFQEKKMEEQLMGNYHLANLGYCRFGRNMEYLLLKSLLKHKSPRLIVIEVHEDEEKNSHDIFPYLAETQDLFLTPTPINRDYLADLFHGTSARLECLKATYIFRKQTPTPSNEPYGYGASTRTVTDDELKENKTAWQKRFNRARFKPIEEIQLKYPLAYLNKMVNLIRKKNIPFLFVYLPEYGSMLRTPQYTPLYQDIAPLLIPPMSIFEDPINWMDAGHLNDRGAELLSIWMAEKIKEELCINPAN